MLKWINTIALPCISVLLLGSVVSAGEVVSMLADQREVAVTIYNEDLALVRDQRLVDLPKGTVDLAMREVSARFRPEKLCRRSVECPPLAHIRMDVDRLLTRTAEDVHVSP